MVEWWGGRDLRYMLPKLFFNHFNDSSFIVEENNSLVGFLVGFFSQSRPEEAYIHFSGIDPRYRKKGIGTLLYNRFFELCRSNGRSVVRCCTSPVNSDSIAYHTAIGFDIEPGDAIENGVDVTLDYNREGDPKVLFRKKL